jgi:murein DD-endopeptidase MepM/ murein hydrolase activator NlpD
MRVVCSVVLSATLLVAACGSPMSGPEVREISRVGVDLDLRAETRALAARVTAGMTLASLFQAAQVSAAEATEVIAAVRSVFDPRKVRPNRSYRLVQAINGGALRQFEYEIDDDQFLRVSRPGSPGNPGNNDASWVATVLPIPKRSARTFMAGTIDRAAPSLFQAVDVAGGNVDLSLALAEIFSGDIDFNTELQPGDNFALVVDEQFRESTELGAEDAEAFAGYGPIFAAEFQNDGRRIRAFRFQPEGGSPAYFDENGVSMRRFMLRSPLKFDPVVTSRFSRRRLHPILGEYRAHLGVDYRAPIGAPVVAVADGVVVGAGMRGGAGRVVHLRHTNGFETEYLHLSATLVRSGTRVRQGDVIGRVGATGLATGPHLDYRVKRNGVFINPLTASRSMPPADPVPPDQMAAFHAFRDRVLAELLQSSGVESP